jgi:drug/metabolite transporter (DMT)-like permease
MRRDALGSTGDSLPSVTLGNLIAALAILPFVWRELPQMVTPSAAGIFLYLGVIQMGLAYLLFGRGLKTLSAATASLVAMLEPVLNPFWVFLGTGERPGSWSLIGGAVVVGAVAARTWAGGRAQAARPPPPEASLAA